MVNSFQYFQVSRVESNFGTNSLDMANRAAGSSRQVFPDFRDSAKPGVITKAEAVQIGKRKNALRQFSRQVISSQHKPTQINQVAKRHRYRTAQVVAGQVKR